MGREAWLYLVRRQHSNHMDPTMTDFRALCVELLEWAEHTSAHYVVHPDVILRARAALAEHPVKLTDEE